MSFFPSLSITNTHAHKHTLMSFMSLIFVSNFLQEVPLMTTPFIGPQGAAVHLSWQPQTGKGAAQTIGARVISSDHQAQTWALSHAVHFHTVEGLHPSLTPFFLIQGPLSANINPAEQVKLACHIKGKL